MSALIAMGYAVTKTPIAFWLTAWVLQGLAFFFALLYRDRGHWPSTLFGILELAYVCTLCVFMYRGGVSLNRLSYLFLGLLFGHGIIYLVAAKPFLVARGHLKPKPDGT